MRIARKDSWTFYCCIIGFLLCISACSGKSTIAVGKQENGEIEHFWDKYDFADTILIHKPEITEQMLVDYLGLLPKVSNEQACHYIKELVKKSDVNITVNRWLIEQLEHYLYDPNSPMRNDEYYIPVLDEILNSGKLNGMMRMRPTYQLKMLKKNSRGTQANNFTFVSSDGQKINLWDISIGYTLLLFYDPFCEHCRRTINELAESSVINSLLAVEEPIPPRLTLAAICMEGDMEEWQKLYSVLPAAWLNGYDSANELMEKELYFLRSFPSLYLLDKDKKVLLKDASIEEVLYYLSEKI